MEHEESTLISAGKFKAKGKLKNRLLENELHCTHKKAILYSSC